jgi:aminoglycoside phosphotransferase (APT) family kinase protein
VSDLDSKTLDWIGGVTGGEAPQARLVSSGGRQGYRVDVVKDGQTLTLFLQRGRPPGVGLFSPLSREAEVLRALEAIGIKVPHVWGVSEQSNVVLLGLLDGVTWFQEPPDADQRTRIAQDFIRQIAKWHATPAAQLNLPSFQPIRTAREHQLEQLRGIRAAFEEADAASPIDLLARATLDFLEAKAPNYDGAPVLCQGDTGPGNFMYKGDEVAGIVDWELAHIGDPMDDIAWLSWRATQHGFPDFPARMREYEALSGIAVVPERVRYYRVNACARLGPWFGLADMGQAAEMRRLAGGEHPTDNDRTNDGSQMIMSMLHRRMRLEALGDALGISLPPRYVTEESEPHEHAGIYANVLRQLQIMTPLIADKTASALAKGVARQVKYLKEIDRNFTRFEQQELADMSGLLGRTVQSLDEGRPALAAAARDGKVSFEAYFLYHWNRMVRDDHMMREASGRIYERAWPALA